MILLTLLAVDRKLRNFNNYQLSLKNIGINIQDETDFPFSSADVNLVFFIASIAELLKISEVDSLMTVFFTSPYLSTKTLTITLPSKPERIASSG